jgi:hypothetical protein
VGFSVALLLSCAPNFPYARVIGPGQFELACPAGFPQCAAMAGNLCMAGYNVEATKSGATSSGAVVRCLPPKVEPPPAPVVECPPTEPIEAAKPKCAADYQCTELNAKCVAGSCVVVLVVASAVETDRCMVGKSGSADPAPMFPTEGALADFISSNPESRAAAFMTVTRLDGVWVDAGVRCKTLGQFARGRHVQIISGTFAGREGWLGTESPPTSSPPSPSTPLASASAPLPPPPLSGHPPVAPARR